METFLIFDGAGRKEKREDGSGTLNGTLRDRVGRGGRVTFGMYRTLSLLRYRTVAVVVPSRHPLVLVGGPGLGVETLERWQAR